MSKLHWVLGGASLGAITAAIAVAAISPGQSARDGDRPSFSEPSEHHDVLERLAGRWSHEVKTWAAPDAQAEVAAATADYRWVCGGRFLIGRYDGYINGAPFNAMDVLGYDNFRRQFNSFWIDNTTTAFTLATGQYAADKGELVFEGVQDDAERSLRDRKFRIVYRFVGADRMEIEVFRPGGEGGALQRTALVTGTRID